MLSSKSTLLSLWFLLSLHTIVGGVAEICRGTHCLGSETGDPRPCSGPHCPLARSQRPSRQHNPTTQVRSPQVALYNLPTHHNTPSLSSAAVQQPQRDRFTDEDPDGARTVGTEGSRPRCTGLDCHSPQRNPQAANDTRDCKGIECKLPLKIRLKPRPRACAGDGCLTDSDDDVTAASHPTLVHLPDRAAQFLADLPDFGNPVSDQGSAPLGVQLTCDIKPGENEVPSEDALILHLQLAKGQEKLVEALRSQQTLIRDLQQRLADQQGALLAQQREILEQQRRMSEQMDVVKAQYGLLAETLKQASFQGLQGELQSYFESHLAGLQSQARSHLHKSYAVHKVDVDAKVMDVPPGDMAHLPRLSNLHQPETRTRGHPVLACPSACGPEQYCDFQREPPSCQSCTMCPPGFFLVSQCSPTADRLCQDRDECLEIPNACGERVKCLNTPGGFRCLGVSEREASAGLCGHEYFYNQELQECQACSDCDGTPIASPCTTTSDAVCGPLSDSCLSQVWSAASGLPSAKARAGQQIIPGLQLSILGGEATDLLSSRDGQLTLKQHGLLWVDHNIAVKHGCRNYLQVGVRVNGSEEEVQELSSVRLEQPDRKRFQGVSVSLALEVEPNYTLSLFLRSPNQHCNQSRDLQAFDLSGPSLSLLWLSHDTGAVAMTAHMTTATAHYQTSYRPTFRVTTVSDPYMLVLTHDGRGVRFTEAGVGKFVLQQALYAMGHTCMREGFSLVAYVTRNGSSSEVARAFKPGVNYRDTSVTLSAATHVEAGDALTFELLSPAQCSVRYFGDSSGISVLSMIWIPSAASCVLAATVARAGLPSGAVRNKALVFRQLDAEGSPPKQVRLAGAGDAHPGRNFVFREEGTVNVALTLKLIHSCSVVKLSLHRQGAGEQSRGLARGQAGAAPLAQQVSGHMPEGSEWASVGLRTSFAVQNGTAVYVTLDCLRGRINQISQDGGPSVSILWVAM